MLIMVCPRLDPIKINKAYQELDKLMGHMVNELKLNYYEVMNVFAMMDGNIKQQNISTYLSETVTRFCEKLNEEDKALK
jgi:hypothetical protein